MAAQTSTQGMSDLVPLTVIYDFEQMAVAIEFPSLKLAQWYYNRQDHQAFRMGMGIWTSENSVYLQHPPGLKQIRLNKDHCLELHFLNINAAENWQRRTSLAQLVVSNGIKKPIAHMDATVSMAVDPPPINPPSNNLAPPPDNSPPDNSPPNNSSLDNSPHSNPSVTIPAPGNQSATVPAPGNSSNNAATETIDQSPAQVVIETGATSSRTE